MWQACQVAELVSPQDTVREILAGRNNNY